MQWLTKLWDRALRALFPRVTRYELHPRVLSAAQALARETHPKEAFGVLRGSHRGNTLFVREISYQPFLNTTRSATVRIDTYTLSDLVGTFHSHPSPNAQPSKADKELFRKHPGVHLICPYPYTSVAVYSHHGELLDLHKI